MAGPHSVILVRQWRPEERHNPVPRYLVHSAFIAMHRLHHVLEDRVEELPTLLGIAVRQQLHRSPRVGEEDRDLLPLTLKRGFRHLDPLCQMLGGVRNGGRNCVRVRGGELAAARPAETLAAGDLGSAVRAGRDEPSTALLAKPRLPGVFRLAPWTLHGGTLEVREK